jgi:hypothetical protein
VLPLFAWYWPTFESLLWGWRVCWLVVPIVDDCEIWCSHFCNLCKMAWRTAMIHYMMPFSRVVLRGF